MALPEKLTLEDFKGNTQKKINTSDLAQLADQFGINLPSIQAILQIESSGSAWNPSGTLKMLFEAHIFGRLTNYKYNKSHPNISTSTWAQGRQYYLRGDREYSRFLIAADLDRNAAFESASWGLAQIMGFNAKKCKYASAEDMVEKFLESELEQVKAMFQFIVSTPYIDPRNRKIISPSLIDAIKRKDWAGFAYGYNGPKYAENDYDKKLEIAYMRFGGK